MKTVYQPVDVLLSVLLLRASKLLINLTQHLFELGRNHYAVLRNRSPHLFEKVSESLDQNALVAHDAFSVDVILVCLGAEVLMEWLEIYQAL